MSKSMDKQRRTPSNYPDDGNVFSMMLETLSVDELTDALNDILENMTEEDYDSTLIDAYLFALDRKDPMPEIPDAETSYADFQKRILRILPERKNRKVIPSHRFRRFWRIGLVAALTIICILAGMMVAQAAGLDVFGAIAGWTDKIFSLGEIRSDGARDVSKADGGDSEADFASLQEVLDIYSITEVSEPAWIPDGYTFCFVSINDWPSGEIAGLTANYFNGTDYLVIKYTNYQDEPDTQIEKLEVSVETFAVNDTMVYLLENDNNNSAVWVTEHYECFIGGTVSTSELRQMVLSTHINFR